MKRIDATTGELIAELERRFDDAHSDKIESQTVAGLQQMLSDNDYVILLNGYKCGDNPLRSD